MNVISQLFGPRRQLLMRLLFIRPDGLNTFIILYVDEMYGRVNKKRRAIKSSFY